MVSASRSSYTYDKRNLQTTVTNPLGHTTTYGYDAFGNRESVTDALNHTTEYVYNTLNSLETIIDPTLRETTMVYDEVGNLTRLTDASLNATTYTYDDLNRLETETITVDGADLTRTYGYDAAGNLTHLNDRNQRDITFKYDALDRQSHERWVDGSNNLLREIAFTYNDASQLESISDVDSTYTYDYDLAGRLKEVDNAGTTGLPHVVLTYDYDKADNLTSVTDTINGNTAGVETFTYDALNRVERITQSGTGVADKRVDIDYDAASQRVGLSRYSSLDESQPVAQTTYGYDLAGRLEYSNFQNILSQKPGFSHEFTVWLFTFA